jgi:hypothetical protein
MSTTVMKMMCDDEDGNLDYDNAIDRNEDDVDNNIDYDNGYANNDALRLWKLYDTSYELRI